MAEIEEIPLGPQGSIENTENHKQANQENPEEAQADASRGLRSQPAPQKRGRPPGARNKPKPPPKPKPKPSGKKEPENEDEDSEEEETQPPRRRGRVQEQPQELDRHALASEVLSILQQQKYSQTNARRNHYASWFQNL